MYDQLHVTNKESQFVFVNPFTISLVGFTTPETNNITQLSKALTRVS